MTYNVQNRDRDKSKLLDVLLRAGALKDHYPIHEFRSL